MNTSPEYRHFHETSSEWFQRQFLDYSTSPEQLRPVHHHRIVDTSTGAAGEGFGWTYGQAEELAWDDLQKKSAVEFK